MHWEPTIRRLPKLTRQRFVPAKPAAPMAVAAVRAASATATIASAIVVPREHPAVQLDAAPIKPLALFRPKQ